MRGTKTTTVDYNRCEADVFCVGLDAGDLASDLTINNLVETYLEHWIDDVEVGLKNWSDLGLATTKALFDPRSHRAAQDHICRNETDDENSLLRSNCEDGVGPLDVIGYESEDYINDHLISMLGAPDIVGDLNELFGVDLRHARRRARPAEPAGGPDRRDQGVRQEQDPGGDRGGAAHRHRPAQVLRHLAHALDRRSSPSSLELPGLGTQQLDLFEPSTHPKLDALMHLPADHHENQQVKLPGVGTVPSTGLKDSAVFDAEEFAAYRNAVQTAKLLLLDGNGLNAALGDILKAKGTIKGGVATYPANGNLMTTQLYGTLPWLRSIDSDHSWRSDGRPRFCAPRTRAARATARRPRPEEHDAGNDTFPVWESCLLRPTFATLYRDWENGTAQFPALGDAPSADPSDPDAPTGTLLLAGTTYTERRHDVRRRQPPVHGQGGRRRVRRQPGSPCSTATPRPGSIPGAWKDIAAERDVLDPGQRR